MAKKETFVHGNKPLPWSSAFLGCLPSPTDVLSPSGSKPKLTIPKQNEKPTSDKDDAVDANGLDDHEIFKKLAHQIDHSLNQARSQDSWSDKLGSISFGMLISSGWINSLPRGSKSAYDKLKSTRFEDITTTAEDILAVIRKVHVARSGLLVVAAVIHNIQKLKRVDKECIDLLASVNTVSRSVSRFKRLPYIPEEMKDSVIRAKKIISKSAASCLSIIHSQPRYKLFFSSRNDKQMSSCKEELQNLQRQLEIQLSAHYSDLSKCCGVPLRRAKQGEETKNSTSESSPEHYERCGGSLCRALQLKKNGEQNKSTSELRSEHFERCGGSLRRAKQLRKNGEPNKSTSQSRPEHYDRCNGSLCRAKQLKRNEEPNKSTSVTSLGYRFQQLISDRKPNKFTSESRPDEKSNKSTSEWSSDDEPNKSTSESSLDSESNNSTCESSPECYKHSGSSLPRAKQGKKNGEPNKYTSGSHPDGRHLKCVPEGDLLVECGPHNAKVLKMEDGSNLIPPTIDVVGMEAAETPTVKTIADNNDLLQLQEQCIK